MPDPLRIQTREDGESMVPSLSAVPQRMSHQKAEPENTPATSIRGDTTGPRLVKMAEKLRMELAKLEGLRLRTSPEGYPKTSTVSFTIDGVHANDIAVYLGERGLFVWDGDFYAIEITNHVLKLEEQGGLLRIGLAPYNTMEEIDRTICALQDFIKERKA